MGVVAEGARQAGAGTGLASYSAELSNMRLSVLITVASHHQRWLQQALDSVLRQTYREFDVLVLFDGMPPEEPASIADDRVRQVIRPWCGRPRSLQTALQETEGDLVCWVDADDTVSPDAFEKCIELYAKTGKPVYTDHQVIDETGRPLDFKTVVGRFPFHLVVIPRWAIETVGGFDPEMEHCCDAHLIRKVRYLTGDFHYIPEKLYQWRRHTSQMSWDLRNSREWIKIARARAEHWWQQEGRHLDVSPP